MKVGISLVVALGITASICHGQMRRGRILTPENKPLAGAKVVLIDTDDFRNYRVKSSTLTDADGVFGFTDLPQYPYLLVQAPGYAWSHAMVGGLNDEQPVESKVMPATSLAVTLIGPDDLPAAGVRVSITMIRGDGFLDFAMFLPDELEEQLMQITDAQGVCTIDRLPQGCVVRLDVLDDRYASLSIEYDIHLAAKPQSDGGVLKLVSAATVSGRVVRADTGAPVAGIRVGAQGMGHNNGWGDDVTDAQGRYVLKQLGGGLYNIALDLRGELGKTYTAVAHAGLSVRAGEKLEQKDFTLIPGGLIRGRASVAGSNKPVPDLHIGVYGPAHPKTSAWVQGMQTAADGSFELRVPPGQQYLYMSQQTPAGLLGPEGKERNVTVADGQVTSADFIFKEDPTPGISGLVVDTNGKPVADAGVGAEYSGDQPFGNSRWGKTDADGRFTIPAVPNGSLVRATKGRAISVERIVVSDDNRILALTIRNEAHASIKVRVLLPDGAPAAGAPVSLLQWEAAGGDGMGFERKADADGMVIYQSLDPQLRYDLSAGGEGFTRAASENVQVFPAQTSEITLVVTAVDGFVAGTVVDADGKPVPDVSLSIGGRQSGRGRMIKSDSNGRFRVTGLVPGDALTIFPQSPVGLSQPTRTVVGAEDVKVIYDPKPIPPRPERP